MKTAEDLVTREGWLDVLRNHDLDPKRILVVEIVPEGITDGKVMLRVEQFAADSSGNWPTPDPRSQHQDEAAREVVWVPMKYWPAEA